MSSHVLVKMPGSLFLNHGIGCDEMVRNGIDAYLKRFDFSIPYRIEMMSCPVPDVEAHARFYDEHHRAGLIDSVSTALSSFFSSSSDAGKRTVHLFDAMSGLEVTEQPALA